MSAGSPAHGTGRVGTAKESIAATPGTPPGLRRWSGKRRSAGGTRVKRQNFNIWYWVAALFGLLAVQYVVGGLVQPVATLPYSQFQQLLNEGKVAEVGVSDRFL